MSATIRQQLGQVLGGTLGQFSFANRSLRMSLPGTPSASGPPPFPPGADVRWLDPMTVQCKGVKLRLTHGLDTPESTAETITLFKDPDFLRTYLDHLDGHQVDNMVEVGVWDGGSAIFFWNLLKPRKLCCVDLKEHVPHLTDYVAREGLAPGFRVFLNFDQSNYASWEQMLAAEFGAQLLDLVLDDASHLYWPSRITFEALFPRLRPGGLYFLEDWKSSLINFDEPPLHQLVQELIGLSMLEPGIISSVTCVHNFVIFQRGPADYPRDGFAWMQRPLA